MTDHGGLRIRVDPPDLDIDVVHRWLSTDAYWAIGRSREVIERAAAGSVNLVADDAGTMIGYARLVTDRVLFAWLCDVYVDPAARGAGVGSALVAAVADLLDRWGLRRALLKTDDAHGLYAAHGFGALDEPEKWMIRLPVGSAAWT